MTGTDVVDERRVTAGAELVARAREVAEVLAAHAEQTERDLRPAPESIAAVREAGLFAMAVPTEFGGAAASLRDQTLALTELGRACPSTAWVTGLNAGGKQMLVRALPEQARAELFADPDAVMCASSVPQGVEAVDTTEGLRISGRWAMASGCEDARWAVLGVPVMTEGQPPRITFALVPTADLTVERTWRSAGMAGTGSHTLRAVDVLVPRTRGRAPMPMSEMSTVFPASMVLRVNVDMLGGLLGATQAALKIVEVSLAGNRAPHATTYRRMAESPLARYWFSEATHLVDTATTRILSVADALDAVGEEEPPLAERARLRMELVAAAAECRQALEKLMDLHGASGFALDNPLQRLWRDVAVGTRHPALVEFISAEDYGRVLLDAEPPRLTML